MRQKTKDKREKNGQLFGIESQGGMQTGPDNSIRDPSVKQLKLQATD